MAGVFGSEFISTSGYDNELSLRQELERLIGEYSEDNNVDFAVYGQAAEGHADVELTFLGLSTDEP